MACVENLVIQLKKLAKEDLYIQRIAWQPGGNGHCAISLH